MRKRLVQTLRSKMMNLLTYQKRQKMEIKELRFLRHRINQSLSKLHQQKLSQQNPWLKSPRASQRTRNASVNAKNKTNCRTSRPKLLRRPSLLNKKHRQVLIKRKSQSWPNKLAKMVKLNRKTLTCSLNSRMERQRRKLLLLVRALRWVTIQTTKQIQVMEM